MNPQPPRTVSIVEINGEIIEPVQKVHDATNGVASVRLVRFVEASAFSQLQHELDEAKGELKSYKDTHDIHMQQKYDQWRRIEKLEKQLAMANSLIRTGYGFVITSDSVGWAKAEFKDYIDKLDTQAIESEGK